MINSENVTKSRTCHKPRKACFEVGTILNEQLKKYFQKLCCMFTFAFESATFSWLLLFITKYRASSKKSSTSTLFFCLDEALATLLLMWRLSVDELSLSSLDWVPSIGDVAFLFLLFTLDFFSCSLSSASLRFSIKRKSQLLQKSGIVFIKTMPSLFAISFNLTPSFVINAKMKETFLAGTVANLTSTVWTP